MFAPRPLDGVLCRWPPRDFPGRLAANGVELKFPDETALYQIKHFSAPRKGRSAELIPQTLELRLRAGRDPLVRHAALALISI
jgi:hypothetical protein